MTIKYKIEHNTDAAETFPAFYILKLKNDNQYIILVTGREGDNFIGTVVTKSAYSELGETSEYWDVRQFERLKGSFTVTQD